MIIGSSLLNQLSPEKCRATGNTCMESGFTIGMLLATAWGFADNYTWMWRLATFSQIIFNLTFFILSVTYFSDFDSPIQLIKAGKKEQVRGFMKTYIST